MSYIDRDRFIKLSNEFMEIHKEDFDSTGVFFSCMLKEFLKVLENAPTEDVAPIKHGKWQERTFYDDIVCTECGHFWNVLDNCTETFNYCPHCGAKMDLESGEGR